MLTKETTIKLCKFLITIGEEEKNLEVVRQILSEQPDFEPYAAFSRIDRSRNGFITVDNVREFLANNGLVYDDSSCQAYIQHYNFNDDGRLTFEQFLNSVLPQENQALRTIVTQRKTYQIEPNELLSYDVEYALAKVFDREIQFYKKMDAYKKELKNCRDFSAKDAFYTIDMYNSNFIDFEKLGDFLMKQGHDLFEDQLISIIRNMDKNDDGQIDLFEFIEAVEPRFVEQNNLFSKSVYREQQDPVQIFKDSTKTVQQFYHNNQGIQNPSEIFKQYIAPNQRTVLSIQKHVDNNRNQKILNDKKQGSTYRQGIFGKNNDNAIQKKYELKNNQQQQQQQKILREKGLLENEICELARNLKLFIGLDKEMEIYKQNLVSRQDFTLVDAFRLFDIDGKGICQPGNFMDTFNQIGLFPTKYELYLVLKRYDYDNDGKLSFQEFKEMLVPVKKEYEAMANERAPRHQDLFCEFGSLWSFETRQNFIELIKIMLQNEAALESLRQRLNKRKYFNLKTIFTKLDQDEDGYLRVADFKRVFDQAGILIDKTDIYYLILRFDRNNNAKVSYSEFISELSPKSSQKF